MPAVAVGALVLAGMMELAIVPAVPTPQANAIVKPGKSNGASFDDLMARAEQERSEGDHSASARSFAEAVRVLPPRGRVGLKGELALDNALADYRLARDAQPQHAEWVEEPIALLEEFIELRQAEHAAGKAEAVPVRMTEALVSLRALAAEPPPEVVEDEAPIVAEPPPEATTSESADDTAVRRRALGGIIGGTLVFAGGTTLLGVGLWNFAQVERQTDIRLSGLLAGEYTPAQRTEYRASLDHWRQRWRETATGLVAVGSVAMAAGIGLTVWGAIALRRSRARAQHVRLWVPTITRDRGALGVAFEF